MSGQRGGSSDLPKRCRAYARRHIAALTGSIFAAELVLGGWLGFLAMVLPGVPYGGRLFLLALAGVLGTALWLWIVDPVGYAREILRFYAGEVSVGTGTVVRKLHGRTFEVMVEKPERRGNKKSLKRHPTSKTGYFFLPKGSCEKEILVGEQITVVCAVTYLLGSNGSGRNWRARAARFPYGIYVGHGD